METPPPGFLLEPEGVGVAMVLAARTTAGLRIEDTAEQCQCELESEPVRADHLRRHVIAEKKEGLIGSNRDGNSQFETVSHSFL